MHMFSKKVVSLIALTLMVLVVAVKAEATAVVKKWGFYTFGSGIAASGSYIADIDGDNKKELVVGGGNDFGPNNRINVVKSTDTGYQIVQQYVLNDNATTSSIQGYYDKSTDNHFLYVATSNGSIQIYNLTVGKYDSSIAVTDDYSYSYKLLLQDVDKDDVPELIVVGSTKTQAIDTKTSQVKYTYPFGADNAVFGHFSSSNSVDIALSSGYVYSIYGNDSTLIWNNSNAGFGYRLVAVDSNNDGVDELIGAEQWQSIKAFDIKNKVVIWSKTTALDIAALSAYDIDADGISEVLYGDGQWGSVNALSSSDGSSIFSIPNPEHGVTNIIVSDIDNDGKQEILWGAGYSSTGPDHLYIYDLATKQKEWISTDISGPFYAFDLADVDNDGKQDILAISNQSNSGYGDGILYVFDGETFKLKWSSEATNPFGRTAWTGIHDLKVGDVDNDGQNEIVVATDRLYDGALYVLDGKTGQVKFNKFYDSGSPIYSISIIDIDGDGANEIVTGSGVAHTGSAGAMIYILNGKTGEVIKQSPAIAGWSNLSQLDIFDANSDGKLDVSTVVGGDVYVYDVIKNTLKNAGAIDKSAITHGIYNTSVDLIAGQNEGSIVGLNLNFQKTLIGKPCTFAITSLNFFSNSQSLFTCGQEFGLFNLATGSVAWKVQANGNPSKVVGAKMGSTDRFLVGGDSITLYESSSAISNLVTSSQTLDAHFNKAISASLPATGVTSSTKFYVVKAPLYGAVTFTNRATGDYIYTPSGNYVGTDTFTYVAIDGVFESKQSTVSINISNTSPVSSSQNFSAAWRTFSTLTINATDLDGDTLTFKLLSAPARGTLALTDSALGIISYAPEGKSLEPVSFTYEVTDGFSKVGPISAIISFTNDKPVAQALSLETYYTSSLSGILKASDKNSDPLTYQIAEGPSVGSVTVDADTGVFTYQPAGESSYNTTFKYTATDGVSISDPQVVSIKVGGKSTSDVVGKPKSGGGGTSVLMLLLLIGFAFAPRQLKRH